MARDADLDISFKIQRVTVFPDRIRDKLDSPDSGVAVKTQEAAAALVERASSVIGVRRYSGQSPYSRTYGHLKDAGRTEPGDGSATRIIWDHPASRVFHQGAGGHAIGADGKVLFNPEDPARTEGGPFFAKREVFHPGTAGVPFIVDAANQLGYQMSGALFQGSAGPFPIVRVR